MSTFFIHLVFLHPPLFPRNLKQMNNQILKGSLLVALGAASYGLLATFVKIAYQEDYTLAEVTFAQFSIGLAGVGLLLLLGRFSKKTDAPIVKRKAASIPKLIFTGVSLGTTSTFYYLAIQHIPVSIGIVLLMQTVWMGVVLEMIILRKLPSTKTTLAVLLILFGTILATNMLVESADINWVGIGWGLLAAMSYTFFVFTTNRVATEMKAIQKTFWMLIGGFAFIIIFSFSSLLVKFDLTIFLKWGPILALFGTILPPILFSYGMPLTGLGLGTILSSIEIPVSVLMAFFLLNESVNGWQWLGIVIIILTVIILNLPKKKKNTAQI